MIDQVQKRKLLAQLLFALFAVLIVSGSLSGVRLNAGLPFPSGGVELDVNEKPLASEPFQPVFRLYSHSVLIFLLPLVFAIVFLFLVIGQPELRKIGYFILLLSLFIGLIAFLFGDTQPSSGFAIPPQEADRDPSRVGPIGQAPGVFIWLSIGALVLLVAAGGLWLYRVVYRTFSRRELLKKEARHAIGAIRDGKGWRQIIIECYWQMGRVLQEQRGVRREETITAREFEEVLISMDFPAGPVHTLTRLFEAARYGSLLPDRSDESTALDCLEAITGSVVEKGDH